LWRTVRWLRWEQWVGRAWARLPRGPRGTRPAPPLALQPAGWTTCGRLPRLVGASRLHVAGQSRELVAPADWRRPDWPALWLYNAHYFDDLVADEGASRALAQGALIDRWIDDNPAGSRPGWEPYPTSLRLVNWIKWAWRHGAPTGKQVQSLADQARWLGEHMEWHLLGNHLWANAKALLFAGTFFDGPEAGSWRRTGLALLRRELREQLLADGGHFERSPMYHAIVLEDLLDLVQLAQRRPDAVDAADGAAWATAAAAMLGWLRAMTHPDGGPAFFNDTAFDVAPTLAALEAYFDATVGSVPASTPAACALLRQSGFARAMRGPAVLLADVGGVAPDYLPGHAHAGTLGFECSIDGHRCIVNTGISEYGAGPERVRQRGTAAHSTLELDGRDSSEVWSGFRVGRRARVCDARVEHAADDCVIAASQDGYAWLPGHPVHARRWTLGADGLEIEDAASATGHARIVRMHVHPDWTPTLEGDGQGWLRGPGRPVRWRVRGAVASIEASAWHRGFAQSQPALALRFDGGDAAIVARLAWEA
jgi:uncharacterized heparinase superfamily protein